jgi:23S rRNA (guanosine2251-2'-O)-methyltransferase
MAKEWIAGRNPVYEALRAHRRQPFQLLVARNVRPEGHLPEILKLAQARRLPVREASREQLDQVSTHHQGVALEVGAYPYSDLLDILNLARHKDEPPFVLLLDSLNDPQNFGTLLRTAEAVGVHGIVLPLAHSVEVTPAVVNASSGASEHLLIAQANLSQTIDSLKAENVWVVGLDQAGAEVEANSRHLRGALGLVVGSEGEGIRPLVKSK